MAGDVIGFVSPRYGSDVVGGAEAVMAEAAHGLAERGHKVELLTSCAKDHYTWENVYPEGVTEADGIKLRRFEVELDTPGVHRSAIGNRILMGDNVSLEDQVKWANDSMRSSGLWHHVSENIDDYRVLIFAPYQFWGSYSVSQVHPRKSLIMPCMHEEPEAHLEIFQPVINGASAIWFLTDPEADTAHSIFEVPKNSAVVGAAVDIPESYDVESFKQRYNVENDYIYYAGRREWGKGWLDLVAAFGEAKVPGLKLLTSGVGEIDAAPEIVANIIDVGFLSDEDRNAAMAGAIAYVQPSDRESFSRTVLEAWLAGTPVIANGRSDVVAWHIERSNAGFAYSSQAELISAIQVFATNPTSGAELAASGRKYVLDNYQWKQILDNMENTLDKWFPTDAGGST